MIIPKNILNISNLLYKDDMFSPGVIFKRNGEYTEAYASNGYMLMKVKFHSYSHEDFPAIPDFDFSIVDDFCVELTKETCESMKKMIGKNKYMFILNSVVISEFSDVEQEERFVLSTDLDTTSKTKFKCKHGNDSLGSISWFMESVSDQSNCTDFIFDAFKMADLMKVICDVLGLKRQDKEYIRIQTGEDKFHAMTFTCEYNGIDITAYLMPCVK